MTQKKYILSLLKKNKNAVVIGSLGTISNDLEELGGQGNELRLVRGAMGCVLGIGLGMAMSSRRNIIVIIGEGSFLMKLGSISTINKYKPKNLKVIILNNGKYQSCGGQENNFKYLFPNVSKNFNKGTYSIVKIS